MVKTVLVLAVALAAGRADAQVRRLDWNAPDFGTPSVRDLVQNERAPATPPSAPKSETKTAAACPDAPELNGLTLRVTLDAKGRKKPLIADFAYAGCVVETPRDEPPAPPYTRRTYQSAKGDALSLYSDSASGTSTVSFSYADGNHVANALPALPNAKLVSGRPLDLGVVLLVKIKKGMSDGTLTQATGSIKSISAK